MGVASTYFPHLGEVASQKQSTQKNLPSFNLLLSISKPEVSMLNNLFNNGSNWYNRYKLLIHLLIWGIITFPVVAVLEGNNLRSIAIFGILVGSLLSVTLFLALFHLYGAIGQLLRIQKVLSNTR